MLSSLPACDSIRNSLQSNRESNRELLFLGLIMFYVIRKGAHSFESLKLSQLLCECLKCIYLPYVRACQAKFYKQVCKFFEQSDLEQNVVKTMTSPESCLNTKKHGNEEGCTTALSEVRDISRKYPSNCFEKFIIFPKTQLLSIVFIKFKEALIFCCCCC